MAIVNDKRLRVTELDFDNIKTNLKTFLKSQEEFKDYDFEGAGINILLDTLAYNTHYLAMNANMLANEMFLDSASLRSSVVSHAKSLGYETSSARAPIATVDVKLITPESTKTLSSDSIFGIPSLRSPFRTCSLKYMTGSSPLPTYLFNTGLYCLTLGLCNCIKSLSPDSINVFFK